MRSNQALDAIAAALQCAMTDDVDGVKKGQSGRSLLVGIAALSAIGLALLATTRSANASKHVVASRYAGAETCRTCHPAAYQKWSNSAHARALNGLSERERVDPKCLQCHTTDADENDEAVVGVQCEACHGQGRYYSLSYVMRDQELRELLGFRKIDEKVCRRCHTESTPSIRPFIFQEKFELIRHDEPQAVVKPTDG